jgi:hypothetical protein
MLLHVFGKDPFRIWAQLPAVLSDVYCGYPLALQTIDSIATYHKRFHPYYDKFTSNECDSV